MPSRGWLSVLAAVGVALAVPAAAQITNPFHDPGPPSSWGDSGSGEHRAPYRNAPTDQEDSGAKQPPAGTEPPISAPISTSSAEPISEENNCTTDADLQTRECRDLIAQEGMAFWAIVTAGLTSIGVILLLRTLFYTRDAANAARDAVDEAKRATRAADRTTNETKRIGEAQVRAYLVLEPRFGWIGHPIDKTFGDLNLWFDLINTGQTPAFDCEVVGFARFVGENNLTYSPTQEATEHPITNTYCGAGRTIPTKNFMATRDEAMDAMRRKMVCLFYVRVSYKDVFEKPRYVEACCTAMIFEVPPANDSMRVAASVKINTYPGHNSAD